MGRDAALFTITLILSTDALLKGRKKNTERKEETRPGKKVTRYAGKKKRKKPGRKDGKKETWKEKRSQTEGRTEERKIAGRKEEGKIEKIREKERKKPGRKGVKKETVNNSDSD